MLRWRLAGAGGAIASSFLLCSRRFALSDPSQLTSSCGLRPSRITNGPWAHFSFFCPEFWLVGFQFGNSGFFLVRAVILIFFLLLSSLSHFVLEVIFICSTTHRGLEKSKRISKPRELPGLSCPVCGQLSSTKTCAVCCTSYVTNWHDAILFRTFLPLTLTDEPSRSREASFPELPD